MKRIITIVLLLALAVSMTAFTAQAALGSGVAVLAEDVVVIKSGLLGQKLRFTDSDFKCAFALPDFESITICTLPKSTEGTLMLAGRRVSEGQTIKRRNIGAMLFIPTSAEVEEASFTFTLKGGAGENEATCKMRFLDKVNYAPKIEGPSTDVFHTTQEMISYFGRIDAIDGEGDELEYIIVRYPENGYFEFLENGEYKYTPKSGFTGYDSVVYAVRDEYGNYTNAQTIKLKTVERMSDVVFEDMKDKAEYNAAVAMYALGAMNGKYMGDSCYFLPDESMTRAEFILVAMKASGIEKDSAAVATFFDDNDKIPEAYMGYVATAQRLGIVDGEWESNKLMLHPQREITLYEVAEILARINGYGDDENAVYSTNSTVPIYARASVSALCTLGVFDESAESINGLYVPTRAEIAEFLYRIINA
ncbi:MAG: S-layer homology domain-containing protein [Clostridia bacterium]|nr:S-layer homology domain-containing protein [Clostridia bacterium]